MTSASSLVSTLVEAWNCGDAGAFAALFGVDAIYVAGDGSLFEGRDAIRGLLSRGPMVPVEASHITAEPGADERLAVSFAWRTTGPGEPRSGLITMKVTEAGGSLQIERLENRER